MQHKTRKVEYCVKKICSTIYLAELVERLEAGGVVDVVGVERDAEEAAARADRPSGKVVGRAAVAHHLSIW